MQEKVIIKDGDVYSFYDDVYSKEDIEALKVGLGYTERRRVVGVLSMDKSVACHQCNKSRIWDDMTGYTDEVQGEHNLNPNKSYIVCYYKYLDGGLEHCVDYGISKEQIISNIQEQRYVEGADYFIFNQLVAV